MLITVGIPVYNEEDSIAQTVLSVLEQNLPKNINLEILVVASGCTDRTVPIVRELSKKNKNVTLLIEHERKGKPSAWNLINQKAKTEWIVFTDGDVILDRDSISCLWYASKSYPKVNLITGKAVAVRGKGFVNFMATFPYRFATTRSVTGYLYMIKRKIVSLPIDIINEDDFLSTECKIAYEPDAKVYVSFPTRLSDYLNQKIRIYTGKFQLSPKRKDKKVESIISKLSFIELLYLIPYFFLTKYCWYMAYRNIKNRRDITSVWREVRN
ncbi:glycosyltransferase [Candidatus Woesearchaeota archaeon]|nr:glycosyltransferase [Candidatus Woesearchaeota archaeon]